MVNKMCPAMKLLITSLVFASVSIACYAVSLATNVWWIIEKGDTKITQGLWRVCTENANSTKCMDRTDLMTFKEKKGTDPIIMCLLLSAGFTKLTITFALSILCCCRNNAKYWGKTMKWIAFFAIISFVAGLDAMLYTEFEYKDILNNNSRGWSYLVAWVGTCLQFILLLLVVVQLCVKPRDTTDMSAW